MAQVSKRFLDRAKVSLRKYQKVLESARARDVNESDTCVIVSDFLADVLGYDKYHEVTTEYAIRNTFCDLAVKVSGRVQYLIEVKPVGTDLKENHLRQALDYAANEGIEWVLLTNGASWQAHRMKFEQPIKNDLVFELDLLDATAKFGEMLGLLYLISREAPGVSAIDAFWHQKEATSRYVMAQVLLAAPSLKLVRRSIRALYPGLRVSEDDVEKVLREEVIKREALEGEKAAAAERRVRKSARKSERPTAPTIIAPTGETLPS